MERVTSVKPQNQSANHIWYIAVTCDLVLFLLLKQQYFHGNKNCLPQKLSYRKGMSFIFFFFFSPVVLKLESRRKHYVFSFWIYSRYLIYFIKDSLTVFEAPLLSKDLFFCKAVYYAVLQSSFILICIYVIGMTKILVVIFYTDTLISDGKYNETHTQTFQSTKLLLPV